MRIFSVVAVLLVMAISTMLQLGITLVQAELARTLNEGVGNANDSSAKQLAEWPNNQPLHKVWLCCRASYEQEAS